MISENTEIQDENELLQRHFSSRQASLWTALPGIVQSFDPVALTCTVQPAIQGKVRGEDGSARLVNLPLLLDCPVVFPHAGGCSLTFPIQPGDECLVVFSCRAIDLWWQSGGVQPPVEVRMHDLSDGFVLPGPYSQPKVIPNVSTTAVQMRSDDGQAYVEINPASHNIAIKTPADVSVDCKTMQVDCEKLIVNASSEATINSPIINLNGAINGGGSGGLDATFTGDVTAQGTSLHTHTHGGVQSGPDNTGAPN